LLRPYDQADLRKWFPVQALQSSRCADLHESLAGRHPGLSSDLLGGNSRQPVLFIANDGVHARDAAHRQVGLQRSWLTNTETNRTHLVLTGSQNGTYVPYVTATQGHHSSDARPSRASIGYSWSCLAVKIGHFDRVHCGLVSRQLLASQTCVCPVFRMISLGEAQLLHR
jgi:hypothetical protein